MAASLMRRMSTGGEVANALVCKTSIRGFNSRPVLHKLQSLRLSQPGWRRHLSTI